MHIGILQTDSVLPRFQAEHGDYPDLFRGLFDQVDRALSYDVYDVQAGLPDEIDCAVYVITGSKCSVYDDLPWIRELAGFVSKVLDAGAKVIGVCFGHQLMAHFFGGEVVSAAAGWAVGVHKSRVMGSPSWLNDEGLNDDLPQVALLSSHKDQVVRLPEGAINYLSNEFCPFGGFTLGDQIITVQGHPEFSKGYARDLMDMRRDVLGEAVYTAGIESLHVATNELNVARWLLAFVQARKC